MKTNRLFGLLPDILINGVCAACLSVNLFQVFLVPASQRWDVAGAFFLSGGVCFLLAIMYLTKKSAIVSSVAVFAAFCIAAVLAAACGLTAGNAQQLAPALFYGIIAVCAAFVFCASKSRPGILILFAAGLILYFFITVLKYEHSQACFAIGLFTTAAMFIRKQYVIAGLRSGLDKAAARAPGPFSAVTLTLCAVGLGLAALLCAAASPVLPPAHKLTLLTKPVVVRLAYLYGVATPAGTPDPNLAGMLDDTQRQKTSRTQNAKNRPTVKNSRPGGQATISAADSKGRTAAEKAGENSRKITYQTPPPWLVFYVACGLALVFLLCAPFLRKWSMRRKHYRRLCTLPEKTQVLLLYEDFLRVIKIYGFGRSRDKTPSEFARQLTGGVDRIEFGGHDFCGITDVFIRANYGGIEPEREELMRLHALHRDILKLMRMRVGRLKFIFRYPAI